MYTIYTFNNNITKEKVIDDLILLLTGETDSNAASFSDAMEPAGTIINTDGSQATWEAMALDNSITPLDIPTTPFTQSVMYTKEVYWTINTEDAYGQVIRSKVNDADVINDVNPVYKYALIFATDTGIGIRVFENWNDTDRIGLNEAPGGEHLYPWQPTGDNISSNIHISASSNHILLSVTMFGERYGPFGVLEHTRASIWDTKSNTFPPFGRFSYRFYRDALQSNTFLREPGFETGFVPSLPIIEFYWCRTLNAYLNVDTVAVYGEVLDRYRLKFRMDTVDASRNKIKIFEPFRVNNIELSNEGGEISQNIDCYIVYTTYHDRGYSSTLNEYINGTDTYILWTHDASEIAIAVRKG